MGKDINAKKFLEKGIIYETVGEFEASFFGEVYNQAKKLVEQIIEDNHRLNCNARDYEKKKTGDILNTISFIGRRGTGKTSAMLSFCEALKYYDGEDMCAENHKVLHFDRTKQMQDVEFFVLDCIDAAALEESENILTLVLANMLNKIDLVTQEQYSSNSVDQYARRGLSQKFENIYDDFLTLRNYDKQNEYSSYEKLRNIASSQKIRKNFATLVQEYLKYLQDSKDLNFQKRKEGYLVIVIDDLDMSHYNSSVADQRNNKSYEIMRNINLYFSIPGVIVLVSYNHDNLHKQCVDFFSERSKSYCNGNGNEKYLCTESAEMASEYMEKVLPPILRLCMPSWKKRDYTDFEQGHLIMIKGLKQYTDIFERYTDDTRLSIKKYVLLLYGEALGIYYDCEGKKRHFLEPITFRDLGTITQMFINQNAQHINECFERKDLSDKTGNLYKKIKNDLYFRFVQEKLADRSDKKLFETWMDMSIGRRGEDIVHFVSKMTEPLGKDTKKAIQKYRIPSKLLFKKQMTDISTEYLRDNTMVAYSYAELVHSIFHMTRNDKKYSKALVECLLHSYTLSLNKIYNDYRLEKQKIRKDDFINEFRKKGCSNNEQLNEYHQIFKNIIGETVCGKWTQYYFPEVISTTPSTDTILKDSAIIGYSSDVILNYKLEKDIVIQDESNICFCLKNEIYETLFVSMLFTDVLDWDEESEILSFDWDNSSTGGKLKINIGDQLDDHDFELTAFFKYTFFYHEYLKKMEDLFKKALERFEIQNEIREHKEAILQQLKETINETFETLWNAYYEWDRDYGNAMLPIYNMDLTYNLIKRIFLENKKKSDRVVLFDSFSETKNRFIHEFKKMLKLFTNHLEKIDQYYFLENYKQEKQPKPFSVPKQRSFTEVFTMCPYLTIIFSSIKKSPGNNIGAYMMGMVKTLMEDMADVLTPDKY